MARKLTRTERLKATIGALAGRPRWIVTDAEGNERIANPIRRVPGGWQWGKHGHIYPNRAGAVRQAEAAHAHGFRERNPMSDKDPASMTASQINAEIERIDKADSKVVDELIAAGRGEEKYWDILNKDDELSHKAIALRSRRHKLMIEIDRRAGPGFHRMPRGLRGPRREHNPMNNIEKSTRPGQYVGYQQGRWHIYRSPGYTAPWYAVKTDEPMKNAMIRARTLKDLSRDLEYWKPTTHRESNPARGSVHTAKWDRCFEDVSAKGGARSAAAVCTSMLGEKGSIKAGHRRKNPSGVVKRKMTESEMASYIRQTHPYGAKISKDRKSLTLDDGSRWIWDDRFEHWAMTMPPRESNPVRDPEHKQLLGELQQHFEKDEKYLKRLERKHNPSRRRGKSSEDYRALYTVWEFLSPSTGEKAIVARVAEPDDTRVQHEYQRVLWRGLANGKQDALNKQAMEATSKHRAGNPLPTVTHVRRVYYVARARKGHEVLYLTRGGKLMKGEAHAARHRSIGEAQAAAVAHLKKFPHSRAYKFEVAPAY